MADLRISALPPLSGALLQAGDPLAIADLSASETKQITAKDLVQNALSFIDDGAIPGTKIQFSLPPGSIGTVELADDAVTALKLSANSSCVVGTNLPVAGAFIGQLAVNETTGRLFVWDGAAWRSYTSDATVNVITGGTAGPVTTSVSVTGDTAEVTAAINNATSGGQVLAGPAGTAGPVGLRRLIGSDLPLATDVDPGAVVVQPGSGLTLYGGTSGLEAIIEIDNNVLSNLTEYHVVRYNGYGLVTGGRRLQSADLPFPTQGTIGAIATGLEFAADGTGVLRHSNQVTAGIATKVAFDGQGHITSAATLLESDIPSLPASKIDSGYFSADRLADRSINAIKLASYATAYIQDTQPVGTGHFAGQLWLNPLAQQIRMWDSNVWVPIGVGALSEQNLRFCGLFDATTGAITILTQFGRDAGYKVGDVLPVATDQLTGSYFVCDTAGNGVAVTAGVAYDPGDWCVCLGVAQGWKRIDTLGGGGGGGASTLDGLIDVDAPSPGAGQVLSYDGSVWKPTTIINTLTGTAPVVVTGAGSARSLSLNLDLLTVLP